MWRAARHPLRKYSAKPRQTQRPSGVQKRRSWPSASSLMRKASFAASIGAPLVTASSRRAASAQVAPGAQERLRARASLLLAPRARRVPGLCVPEGPRTARVWPGSGSIGGKCMMSQFGTLQRHFMMNFLGLLNHLRQILRSHRDTTRGTIIRQAKRVDAFQNGLSKHHGGETKTLTARGRRAPTSFTVLRGWAPRG